jgi:hypothetical protein
MTELIETLNQTSEARTFFYVAAMCFTIFITAYALVEIARAIFNRK